ncbi:MAG: glutamate-1-semialdehyde-2,1-aminomutase [Acidobacteria bacterium]|nr:MAG: glutamate-1-semialdehyde-2,1-aminomutase [Acidobacteriota bacterium]
MKTQRSAELMDEALRLIPGGVNSPVRAFQAVGGRPLFLARGAGAHVWDVDGNRYIDYLGSWGPLIAGHAHARVVQALQETTAQGTSFGAPCELEVQLARKVVERVASVEKVRMVNSGTEATLSAIRLARGATGRDLVVKVQGCYHGHVDALLIQAGSGMATLAIPGSPGVPESVVAQTLVVPFNSLDAMEQVLEARGQEIACVILEPIAGNMGVIPPVDGYLAGVRELTSQQGVVFILDEVMTGFRVHAGGAQALYGIDPDLTTLGKILGGGLPVGAYGGKAALMDQVAPQGPIYQAGTLSGNPLAMRAGLETLALTEEPGFYEGLEERSAQLARGLAAAAREAGVPTYHTRVGAMMCTFFTDGPVVDWDGAARCDTARYAAWFRALLKRGIYVAPSQFEALFVSSAHTEADIDATIEAAAQAFQEN